MLMWLYFLFVFLSIILIIFGFVGGISMFNVVGTIMLMLLGFVLLDDGIEYKVGENITTNVSDGGNATTEQVFDVYETYDDSGGQRFGWFLILLGALAFIYSMYDL